MISLGKFSNSNTSKEVILEKLENGCIKCISHCTDNDGYVRIKYNGKHERLFRVLYIQKYGSIPKGMVIRHKCDHPYCCNIEHLEIGTRLDNVRDMIERGRDVYHKPKMHNFGTNNGSHKLTEQQVKEIYLSNLGCTALSKKYNVSKTNIRYIKSKQQWKWLTDTFD